MSEDPTGRENDADKTVPVDRELILELNFVPDWAKRAPGEAAYGRYEERGGRERRPRRGPGRPRQRHGARRGERAAPPRERRRPEPRRVERDMRPREIQLPEAPVVVRILPEQKQISFVVRQLHGTKRSYPLAQVASLFLDKNTACYFRIEAGRDHPGTKLYRCKTCDAVSLDREALVSHLRLNHIREHFDSEEIETDPPKGSFSCIARCGLSGVLLGPPNHHSCEAKILELHATRFAGVPIEKYRDRIETVSDEVLIEQWKEECRKQVVYRRKGGKQGEGEAMSWAEAEAAFTREIAPSLVVESRRVTIPLAVGLDGCDPVLTRALRHAWDAERRFPRSLLFSLRAAFRHKSLHVFRVGRTAEFVTAVRPSPLDPEHVVDSIREVLLHLRAHPGCTRKQLVATLRPDTDVAGEAATEVLSPLTWLTERGHIIEFYDGTLSVPMPRNKG